MEVFDEGYSQALIDAARNPIARPPAGFSESFAATWQATRQEDLSISERQNFLDKVRHRNQLILDKTGGFLTNEAAPDPFGTLDLNDPTLVAPGQLGTTVERARLAYQKKINDLATQYTEVKSDDDLFDEIVEDSRRIREKTEKVLENTTFSGKIGSFTGAMAATMTDPLVFGSMLFGASASAGIVRTALTEAGIGALSEAMIQPFVYRYKQELGSPYGFEDVLERVATAGVGSAVLGGGIKAVTRGLSLLRRPRIDGVDDLREAFELNVKEPTQAQRDADFVLGEYADIARENPFDLGNPDLDSIHFQATAKAINDVEAGRPVDVQEIVAFHGSPHEFDEFNLTKIGTGEGFQTFGHGLYFAENVEVAKEYAPRASWRVVNKQDDSVEPFVAMVLDRQGKPLQRKTFKTSREGEDWARDVARQEKGSALYRVSIPENQVSKMLDWDKPFTEQSDQVKNVLEGLRAKYRKSEGREGPYISFDATGEQIYRELVNEHVKAAAGGQGAALAAHPDTYRRAAELQASEQLKALGIPGIKYLDQGSREAGEGTRNFVVFDPAIISKTERIGAKLDPLVTFKEETENLKVKIIKERKQRAPTLDQSLGQFVKNSGGVAIDKAGALRGEYDALFENGGRKNGSVKRSAGESPDKIAQLAHEAGFIDEPDPAILAEALGRDFEGDKVYSLEGNRFERKIEIDADRQYQRYVDMEEAAYNTELEARANGILEVEDIQIPTGEVMEREGQIQSVTRSAREMMHEADQNLKMADILKNCMIGGGE